MILISTVQFCVFFYCDKDKKYELIKVQLSVLFLLHNFDFQMITGTALAATAGTAVVTGAATALGGGLVRKALAPSKPKASKSKKGAKGAKQGPQGPQGPRQGQFPDPKVKAAEEAANKVAGLMPGPITRSIAKAVVLKKLA